MKAYNINQIVSVDKTKVEIAYNHDGFIYEHRVVISFSDGDTVISIFDTEEEAAKYFNEKWSFSTKVSVVISNSLFFTLITAVSSPIPTKTFLSLVFLYILFIRLNSPISFNFIL